MIWPALSRIAFLLTVGLAAVLTPAYAQGPAGSAPDAQSRLDRLFDNLAGSETPDEAKRIEGNIEALWLRSGSATADLLTKRALDAYQRDDHAATLTLLTAAIEAAPLHAEAYNKRASIYFVEGDYRRALWDLRRTLQLEPRHYGAWAGLGRLLEQTGDQAGAMEAYRRALALNPHLADISETLERIELIVRGREI